MAEILATLYYNLSNVFTCKRLVKTLQEPKYTLAKTEEYSSYIFNFEQIRPAAKTR